MFQSDSGSTVHKIQSIDNLVDIVRDQKKQSKTVVQCHGVFDLIHPGPMAHFEAARSHGDLLLVTVTADEHVNKGPGRPVFNASIRAKAIAALQCVDYVAINYWPTAVEAIQRLKPDIYMKGNDYINSDDDITGNIGIETQAVQKEGGCIRFTDEIQFSSSNLINDFFNPLPPETAHWIASIRDRYAISSILDVLEQAARLRVLVVGEAIIDEYEFCNGLGKSSKDPILAFQYQSTEKYAGGSLAVVNHISGLCEKVGLVTLTGEDFSCEDYIRKEMNTDIQTYCIPQPGRPTIRKRRFIDAYTKNRLFEVYVMDDAPPSASVESALINRLTSVMDNYDLVIVTDYGHGMMTPRVIDSVCKKAQFLAVNTQANAGNRGFNTISKYPRADYVCLASNEVALETRMRNAGWKELLMEVIKRIECPKFCMTRGHHGSLRYSTGIGFTEAPAFAINVTDRVGAGDAYFSLTAMLEAVDAPSEITCFIGNLAGAEVVGELGNRVSVSKASLTKHITALMK